MPALLPPVGARIRFSPDEKKGPRNLETFSSGTAALAAVLSGLAEVGSGRREVVIPAYACPALVAAIRYANLEAVLADVAPCSPFVAVAEWKRKTTAQTLATIAVNFLGVEPCGLDGVDIRSNEEWPATVYDCCQGWPANLQCPDWAIAIVLSFGRGKPVTLGTGGGVVVSDRTGYALPLRKADSRDNATFFRLKVSAYNLGLNPRVYWWLEKLPFLGLGRTEYRAISSIETMPLNVVKHLEANIVAYERAKAWTIADVDSVIGLANVGRFRVLPALSQADPSTRLLRLPMLALNRDERDEAVKLLRRRGYGATAMYQQPLWRIPGLEWLGEYESTCPQSQVFADTLITLPIHWQVSKEHLADMAECLAELGAV